MNNNSHSSNCRRRSQVNVNYLETLMDEKVHKERELLELDSTLLESISSNSIGPPPSEVALELDYKKVISVRGIKCHCPPLSIDKQRIRFLASRVEPDEELEMKPEIATLLEATSSNSEHIELPSNASQLSYFGQISRNKLVSRLVANMRGRIRRRRRRRRSSISHELIVMSDSYYGNKESRQLRNVQDDDDEICTLISYKVEQLLREVNTELQLSLMRATYEFCLAPTVQIGANLSGRITTIFSQPIVPMIRAPIVQEQSTELLADCETSHKSSLVGVGRGSSNCDSNQRSNRNSASWSISSNRSASGDSGIGEVETSICRLANSRDSTTSKWSSQLKAHVKFRSDQQAIVCYSMGFFARLLDESPLFSCLSKQQSRNSNNNNGKLLSLQEMKLYACVECQNLRSRLRFEWLTKCMTLLLLDKKKKKKKNEYKLMENGGKESKVGLLLNQNLCELPFLEMAKVEESKELRYYDLLAFLLAQLLRRFFLVPALEAWCLLLEAHHFERFLLFSTNANSSRGNSSFASGSSLQTTTKLSVRVELCELPGSVELVSSKPDEEMKQAVNFVVDELAAICNNLPRIETQLESTNSIPSKLPPRQHKQHLLVLEMGDNLLDVAKERLSNLIDRSLQLCQNLDSSFPLLEGKVNIGPSDLVATSRVDAAASTGSGSKSGSGKQRDASKWNGGNYSEIIGLLNKFRNGKVEQNDLKLSYNLEQGENGAEMATSDGNYLRESSLSSSSSSSDDRLHQLRFNCNLLRELNCLETNLSCHLRCYFDLGLVQLDCKPLRDSLIKSVQKERLLLMRINLDDLLKLMERLRLQFDEIEINSDLESAIEDYLSEKWQAKQSQQPKQQVVILTGNDLNLEDNDEDDLEPSLPLNLSNQEQSELVDVDVDGQTIGLREEVSRQDIEEEELVSALVSGHSNEQQLFQLGNAKGLQTSQLATRRVATLVECRLLLGRYEYLRKLLQDGDLEALKRDLEVSFEGLVLLSEFVSNDKLDPTHIGLIEELSLRSSEFTSMLNDSIQRLELSRFNLLELNKLRGKVLSKLVVEFNQLMFTLCIRKLSPVNLITTITYVGVSKEIPKEEDEMKLLVNHLDSIQEVSELAKKLELRLEYLNSQNVILAKEMQLLSEAKLKIENVSEDDAIMHSSCKFITEVRSINLENWRQAATLLASFWLLVEEFETQQMKWLNSDIKRLEFASLENSFEQYVTQLEELERQKLPFLDGYFGKIFQENLEELKIRLERFSRRHLIAFKFLTNRHLSESHWSHLDNLLLSSNHSISSNYSNLSSTSAPISALVPSATRRKVIKPRDFTSLAQFLELKIDEFVEELEKMNEQANVEHQLTMFLLTEIAKNRNQLGVETQERSLSRSLDVSVWLDCWNDGQLEIGTKRYLELELEVKGNSVVNTSSNGSFNGNDCGIGMDEIEELARKMVASHSFVRRFMKLCHYLDLEVVNKMKGNGKWFLRREEKVVRKAEAISTIICSCRRLTSVQLVRASLFVELLRLCSSDWFSRRIKLANRISLLERDISTLNGHIEDIELLINQVEEIRQTDLRVAFVNNEQILIKLERKSIELELEREILATKESLALEKQREASRVRDECIRQITERAIPAIRAATKALDCLSSRYLQTIRSIRPRPPEPIRLVVEAVCILRSCVRLASDESKLGEKQQSFANISSKVLSPERHFDALRGQMIEDYWPSAIRMLNGTHSCKFIEDLRRVDRRSVPEEVMQLIRRKYLSSSKFNVKLIERISFDCGQLAKWIIAVDVFDRVINIVRPKYKEFLESEQLLAELMVQVNSRRHQIELVGNELQLMEDSSEIKIGHKMSLANSIKQCEEQLERSKITRLELEERRGNLMIKLKHQKRNQSQLADRCLLKAIEVVYLQAMQPEDRNSMLILLQSTPI